MKKFMFTLVALLTIAASAKAMSYEQARNEALFLTDKMAYELNLTDAQYEAAYEINLDYLMGVTSYDDVFGLYWERRNADIRYILYSWQWDLFRAATYFYRPLYWEAGYWHFGVYARYPRRDFFYFGRPHFYASYRGGHSWRMNGGHSWYEHRHDHFRPDHPHDQHFGMRNGYDRGDYRNGRVGSSTRYTGRDGHNDNHHDNHGYRNENHQGNDHNYDRNQPTQRSTDNSVGYGRRSGGGNNNGTGSSMGSGRDNGTHRNYGGGNGSSGGTRSGSMDSNRSSGSRSVGSSGQLGSSRSTVGSSGQMGSSRSTVGSSGQMGSSRSTVGSSGQMGSSRSSAGSGSMGGSRSSGSRSGGSSMGSTRSSGGSSVGSGSHGSSGSHSGGPSGGSRSGGRR